MNHDTPRAAAGSVEPHPASPSPADLVARIRTGDPDAEAQLVSRYGQRLAMLLRRWTRDRNTAEDLYQETFLLAFEKIRQGEVRDPEQIASYLHSLAKNISSYHYRRNDRRAVRHATWPEHIELADPQSEHLSGMLSAERAALARRVLAEMPNHRDREVLGRFYLAEQDKAGICRDLDLDTHHFKRVLHRARQRYRTLFEARVSDMRVAV